MRGATLQNREGQSVPDVGAIARAQAVPRVYINGELIGDSGALEAWLKQRSAGKRRAA